MAISYIQDEMLGLSKNACKAWVNFNGTGTVAIRDSYNVSSITDNGTGDYDVNFTNAMADTNYSVGCTADYVTTAAWPSVVTLLTSDARVLVNDRTGSAQDVTLCYLQTFGG